MGFIEAKREQLDIIGYSIDDFVEQDSKARFIVKIVDSLDTKELYNRYSDQGADAIDPRVQLSAWFLGYCEGITSSRKLEYNCKKNLDFIYVSANIKPDHSSLSRFRKRHLDLIPKYFLEIVKQAISAGLSNFKEISLDGTKVKSMSSKKKSMDSTRLEAKLRAVETDISAYLEETENQEEEAVPEELHKSKEKLQKAKEHLEERKEKVKVDYRKSHQVNIEEPEAVMMDLGKKGGSFPGYNAQISTDTKTQIIVNSQVVQDRNDLRMFMNQYERTENNLGRDKDRSYIADGGYNSLGTLDAINKNGIDAYIGNKLREKKLSYKIENGLIFNKSDFVYDKSSDCYICPSGKKLEPVKRENNKFFQGKKYRRDGCNDCKLKTNCLSKSNKNGRRELRRDEREMYADIMKQKISTDEGKQKMFRRKTTVEAVIGNIKSNMGYSRFRLKGLMAVNGEFTLMCIGHNLNKLFKLMGNGLFDPIIKTLLQVIVKMSRSSKIRLSERKLVFC